MNQYYLISITQLNLTKPCYIPQLFRVGYTDPFCHLALLSEIPHEKSQAINISLPPQDQSLALVAPSTQTQLLSLHSFFFFFSVSVIGFISLDEASHITFCNPVLNWDNPSFISYITTMVLFVNFNTGSVYEALVSTADCCNFFLTKQYTYNACYV